MLCVPCLLSKDCLGKLQASEADICAIAWCASRPSMIAALTSRSALLFLDLTRQMAGPKIVDLTLVMHSQAPTIKAITVSEKLVKTSAQHKCKSAVLSIC